MNQEHLSVPVICVDLQRGRHQGYYPNSWKTQGYSKSYCSCSSSNYRRCSSALIAFTVMRSFGISVDRSVYSQVPSHILSKYWIVDVETSPCSGCDCPIEIPWGGHDWLSPNASLQWCLFNSICKNQFDAVESIEWFKFKNKAASPSKIKTIHLGHQHHVNQSGRHTNGSQTLRSTSPVHLSTSSCSQALLDLCKVLRHSARAFSDTPELTCSFAGAFRMVKDLKSRTVGCWRTWDLSAGMGKPREQMQPLHSSAGELVLYSRSRDS